VKRPVRTTTLTILHVEDNPQVAAAIALRFSRDARFRWLGSLPTADTLVERVAVDPPDVVILDLDMPGLDPVEALRRLGAAYPATRVVIFSGVATLESIDRAIECGAWGYVCKIDGDAALIEAVADVNRGAFVLSAAARQACNAS
jgi:DNA-binding NarL/FixJ family response regulator